MLSTLSSYQLAVRDLPRTLEVVQSDAFVKRETEYYLENIGNVDTYEQLIEDDRLFRYVMKAHGLEEMNYAKALVTKVFEEGRDEADAFVNRMADNRYRDLAETFDFSRYGTATTSFDRTQQGVVDKYLRQTLEETEGASNEGVRLALYFERKAPGLTNTEEILADAALSKVVRSTLQIPESTAYLDIDKQVEMLDAAIDVSTFSDPEELAKFIEQFTAIWDATNSVADPAIQLFNQGPAYGVSTNMLLTIQSLK